MIPLCLTQLGDETKAKEYLEEKLSQTTNYDHRNSIMYCMLRHLSKEILPLEDIIHLLPLQRDEVRNNRNLLKFTSKKTVKPKLQLCHYFHAKGYMNVFQ